MNSFNSLLRLPLSNSLLCSGSWLWHIASVRKIVFPFRSWQTFGRVI